MKKRGFSLVEILVALIIISVITAAMAPIITKKILDILIDNPDLFTEISDFDLFLGNYDELTKNAKIANDIYVYNECKNLVLELKEAALQAVEKKNKQKKVKIIS